MRVLRFFSLFSLCLVLFSALPSAVSGFSGGPPLRANWCGQQATQTICNGAVCRSCSDCHTGPGGESIPNQGNGSVSILGLPAGGYDPNVALPYFLNVLLEDTDGGRFAFGGFEVSAMLGTDSCQAGTMTRDVVNEPLTDDPTDFQSGVTFVQHISPKAQVGGAVMWSFFWDPPTVGSGDVVFNVCGNSADGNGGDNSNDFIYCTEVIVQEAVDCASQPPGAPCDDGFTCTDPDGCLGADCIGSLRDPFCDALETGSTCNPGDPNRDPITGCVSPAGAEDCTTAADEDGQGDRNEKRRRLFDDGILQSQQRGRPKNL